MMDCVQTIRQHMRCKQLLLQATAYYLLLVLGIRVVLLVGGICCVSTQ